MPKAWEAQEGLTDAYMSYYAPIRELCEPQVLAYYCDPSSALLDLFVRRRIRHAVEIKSPSDILKKSQMGDRIKLEHIVTNKLKNIYKSKT